MKGAILLCIELLFRFFVVVVVSVLLCYIFIVPGVCLFVCWCIVVFL